MALRRIEALISAKPGTEQGDELDVLATLAEAYEQKQFPIEAADPVEAILFRMEQQGLSRKDLEPLIGSRHRVSEILNRKRNLSLDMIRRLHQGLDIPLEVLVGQAA
jgi:HTH-type transcriptional regulator/antitoxin HigA